MAIGAPAFASVAAAAYRNGILFGMKNLFALSAGVTPFFAQTPASLPPDLPHTRSIMDVIIAAGPVMIPLFILSVVFVMLVIVYLLTIRRGSVVSSGFMATADALLRKRDYLG